MFHRGFQTLKNSKSTRPRAFISFLVFGNPDETLALVFEILHKDQIVKKMFTVMIGTDHIVVK